MPGATAGRELEIDTIRLRRIKLSIFFFQVLMYPEELFHEFRAKGILAARPAKVNCWRSQKTVGTESLSNLKGEPGTVLVFFTSYSLLGPIRESPAIDTSQAAQFQIRKEIQLSYSPIGHSRPFFEVNE